MKYKFKFVFDDKHSCNFEADEDIIELIKKTPEATWFHANNVSINLRLVRTIEKEEVKKS